ncbi:MAG TPA: hypothetical protein VKD00_06985 [Methyloceanibacter sp.]|nr:hypothetical protein [Methyloceanibacter sp.]
MARMTKRQVTAMLRESGQHYRYKPGAEVGSALQVPDDNDSDTSVYDTQSDNLDRLVDVDVDGILTDASRAKLAELIAVTMSLSYWKPEYR